MVNVLLLVFLCHFSNVGFLVSAAANSDCRK